MDFNLFERKSFLNGSWITVDSTKYFTHIEQNGNIVVRVKLQRATGVESNSFIKYLTTLSSQSSNQFIIDFSMCSFVDSTFLCAILTLNKSVKNKIKLVVEDPRQLAIFRITKIDSLFSIFPSLTKALYD